MIRSAYKIYPRPTNLTKSKFQYHHNLRCFATSLTNKITYNNDQQEYRKTIAPWLKFGEYHKGLMSHLSTSEILRALFVLQLCSFDSFVDKSTQLLSLSKRFGRVAEYFVQKTFYDQFVGGDEIARTKVVVDLLHRRGITFMVVPVLEEDVEDEKSQNDVYDENSNTIKEIAKMAACLDKGNPILLFKATGIMPAKTLEQISLALHDHWATPSKLAKVIEEISFKPPEEWTFFKQVSKEDREHFINGLKRSDEFARVASSLGVKVLVDGEFYACKLAISTVALVLMAKYNGQGYCIGDTIQTYLKDAQMTIETELELFEKILGIPWYGKVVRGAYMDRERYLAKRNNVPSPIWDSYEETGDSYNRCVNIVLNYLKENQSKRPHLVVATHNEKSIRLAVENIKRMGISSEDDLVSFGQTFGMADYLSTPLVKSNFKVYKSTPFGSLAKAVPYLARRASENRSVLKGAREERKMLRKELFSRLI